MTTETTGATSGVPGKVDLNDPSARVSRADAMKQMTESRREFLATELDPAQAAMLGQSPPAVPAATNDDDTDAADAAANAERARLEREAAAAEGKDAPVLDATKQSAAQTSEPLLLTNDDLKSIQVEMTVNGEKRLVSGEELLRTAQKTGAADDYIEQARTLLHEVKAIRAGASVAAPAEPATPAKPADAAVREAAIDSVVDNLFNGDVDGAKTKLRELLLSNGASQPADVDAAVERKLKDKVIKDGLRQFGEDHKALIADPVQRMLADQFLYQELGKRGVAKLEDLPIEDIVPTLNKAGTETEGWLARVGGGSGAPSGGSTATTLADRLNRKKKGDELPTAGTRADTSGIAAVKTTTDKLNDMRRARGQPVA